MDPVGRRLKLSMLLKWYGADFAEAAPAAGQQSQELRMLRTIAPWLPPDARGRVEGWLGDGGGVRVEYAPYDWGLNAK